MSQGFQSVKDGLKSTPSQPGCYLMKDFSGEVFYVGKAKNLRARLKSYFYGQDVRIFVQFLEQILADIETVVVNNDIEALILERELIKKYHPRFNIMLRDDKNYILLKLKRPKEIGNKKIRYPRLEIVRKVKKDGARYFGPYPAAGHLRTMVELIDKYFLLRSCNDKVIENRVRPCIQYQIERCSAPCVYEVPSYNEEIEDVILFLNGNHKTITKRLTEKMWDFSKNEQFEAAVRVREQLQAVEKSLTKQVVSDANKKIDQDIIGIARRGPEVEISKILVKDGAWHKHTNLALSDQPFPLEEILRSYVQQFYGDPKPYEEIPHQILLPFDIKDELIGVCKLLEESSGHKVKFLSPTKGKAKKLVDIANKNALISLETRLSKNKSITQALDNLKNILGLKIPPRRMECIDISVIQGADAVGSCVVFIDGMPEKKHYRSFKIKKISGMDDFSMIHEVVQRRLRQAIKEEEMPDLLIVDGGLGQLNAALKALEEENILISHQGLFIIGMAKARTIKSEKGEHISVSHSDERIFLPGQPDAIILKPHTHERYLMERIRDEAHRFAIKAHRKLRDKRTITSEILNIPGVGQKTTLNLLRYFGSLKQIKNASITDLLSVKGIRKKQAQNIYEWLKKAPNK